MSVTPPHLSFIRTPLVITAIPWLPTPLFAQFLLRENSLRRTNHYIIIGFFLICSSLYLIVRGDVSTLAGVYTIAFLSVMALFAIGNMLLKVRRSRLPVASVCAWQKGGVILRRCPGEGSTHTTPPSPAHSALLFLCLTPASLLAQPLSSCAPACSTSEAPFAGTRMRRGRV